MRAPIVIRDVDLRSAPEPVLRRVHLLARHHVLGWLPGDEEIGFEEWHGWVRELAAFVELRSVVAVPADGGEDDVVAVGSVELDHEGNTHVGWLFGSVDDGHRRRGCGTAVARRLVEIAAADGRTSLGGSADEGSPGEAFLASLGLTCRQRARQNRLRTADLDVGLLRSWVERAPERASGYSLRFWEGPTPGELLDDFARCTEVMNTAPLDDLDLQDERMTPERLRRLERARADAGTGWWTTCAVDDATGALVGFTQMLFPERRASVARQNDTGVDPAHRDRGLGRWIKASMLLRLLDVKPDVRTVDTWNAGSNEPMLAINDALGFRPVRVAGNWQGDLGVVRGHLDDREAT